MTALTIHIEDKTNARLRKASEELARDVHDLAECAVAEAVLDYFRHRRDDPARDTSPRAAGETLQ